MTQRSHFDKIASISSRENPIVLYPFAGFSQTQKKRHKMSDTKSTQYKIREAQIEDAARLVEIYSHYITDTAVSFEYEVPSVDEFKADRKSVV